MNAIHYHVRSEGQIIKKAVYIAISINLDAKKDVLGMWIGENESAKFWATVLNGLTNRGVAVVLKIDRFVDSSETQTISDDIRVNKIILRQVVLPQLLAYRIA